MRTIQLALLVAFTVAACAPLRPEPERPRPDRPALEPIPFRDGPLQLNVVHPPAGSLVGVRDSTFIFGSTGTGEARLWIDGAPVEVAPNGAWIGFLPVPADGVYDLVAVRGPDTVRLEHRVRTPPPPVTLGPDSAAILQGTISPTGAWTALPGERIDVSFRGTAGGRATLVLPDGSRVPLVEERPVAEEGPNFVIEPGAPAAPPGGVSTYRGFFAARPLLAADTGLAGPTLAVLEPPLEERPMPERRAAAAAAGALRQAEDTVRRGKPGGVEVAAPGGTGAVLELVVAGDTARAPLPLNLALLERPRVAVAWDRGPAENTGDGYVVGRPGPGTTSHYFWQNGTRLAITGEREGEYRVHLADGLNAWVPAGEVRLLPPGTPPPGGRVGAVRFTPRADWVDLRIATPGRIPYRLDVEDETLLVTLYGGVAATDWLFYGGLDPLLRNAEWRQTRDSVYVLSVELSRPVWGYEAFWNERGDFIVRIRRPPAIDPDRPLRGLLIAVDPGHPPGGATGPTRLTEAEANLGIGLRLARMLEEAGARVLLTRDDMQAVGLYDRPRMAAEAGAHLFVSVHNNAFPDGVNPFENNGTSVYYFHPPSVGLARALQDELLDEFGLRDLGIGRASLAVVRWPTWFPAALTETMFLMLPQQEATLRSEEGQRRIAEAHLRGIRDFLRAYAAER